MGLILAIGFNYWKSRLDRFYQCLDQSAGTMKGHEATTPAQRMRSSRESRQAKGWRQVNIWLSPAAELALMTTKSRLEAKGIKKSQNDLILDAILRRGD